MFWRWLKSQNGARSRSACFQRQTWVNALFQMGFHDKADRFIR